MLGRRKTGKIVLITLQSLAVAIICFGSLINFHQYRIWGKPLIPEFVGYKRDHEKSLKETLQWKEAGSACFNPDQPFFSSVITGSPDQGLPLVSSDYSIPHTASPAGYIGVILSSCGLRAPPATI